MMWYGNLSRVLATWTLNTTEGRAVLSLICLTGLCSLVIWSSFSCIHIMVNEMILYLCIVLMWIFLIWMVFLLTSLCHLMREELPQSLSKNRYRGVLQQLIVPLSANVYSITSLLLGLIMKYNLKWGFGILPQ